MNKTSQSKFTVAIPLIISALFFAGFANDANAMTNDEIRTAVAQALEAGWTPEQIASAADSMGVPRGQIQEAFIDVPGAAAAINAAYEEPESPPVSWSPPPPAPVAEAPVVNVAYQGNSYTINAGTGGVKDVNGNEMAYLNTGTGMVTTNEGQQVNVATLTGATLSATNAGRTVSQVIDDRSYELQAAQFVAELNSSDTPTNSDTTVTPVTPTPTCANGGITDERTCNPTCANGGITDARICNPTCANGGLSGPINCPVNTPTCANGGITDEKICNPTCANGGLSGPVNCPTGTPTCTNGATNYPACTLPGTPVTPRNPPTSLMSEPFDDLISSDEISSRTPEFLSRNNILYAPPNEYGENGPEPGYYYTVDDSGRRRISQDDIEENIRTEILQERIAAHSRRQWENGTPPVTFTINHPPTVDDYINEFQLWHIAVYNEQMNRPWGDDAESQGAKNRIDQLYLTALENYNLYYGTNIEPDQSTLGFDYGVTEYAASRPAEHRESGGFFSTLTNWRNYLSIILTSLGVPPEVSSAISRYVSNRKADSPANLIINIKIRRNQISLKQSASNPEDSNARATNSGSFAALCTAEYFCSGSDQYRRNSDCTETLSENCAYGCSGGGCLSPLPPQFSPFDATYIGSQFRATGHLQVRPAMSRSGDTARLYWKVENVGDCSVTGENDDAWTGNLSGTEGKATSLITAQTRYTLSCNALAGVSPSSISETQIINLITAPVYSED